jgi:hypothetical protein
MTRQTVIEAVLLAVGFIVGVACTGNKAEGAEDERGAPRAEAAIPDDTMAVGRLLAVVRGGDPLVCEMATRAADMHGSWSMWGPLSGDPLTMDSTSAALLDWINHKHTDPSVVPRLNTALHDSDGCVRRMGAALLSRVNHPSATSALLGALDDQQPGTREAAAFGLGLGDTHAAVDPLIGKLHDPSAAVRRAAAWSLGQLEDHKAVTPLIALLRDTDPRVRQTAAWAIGSIR